MPTYADPHEPIYLREDRELYLTLSNGTYRPPPTYNSQRQRFFPKLIKRGDPLVCAYCTAKLDSKKTTIDHRLPISRGGKWHLDNLVLACRTCNSTKSYLTDAEFLKLRDLYKGDITRRARLVLSKVGRRVEPLLGHPEAFAEIEAVIKESIEEVTKLPSAAVPSRRSRSRRKRMAIPEPIVFRAVPRDTGGTSPSPQSITISGEDWVDPGTSPNFGVAIPFQSGYPTGQCEVPGIGHRL